MDLLKFKVQYIAPQDLTRFRRTGKGIWLGKFSSFECSILFLEKSNTNTMFMNHGRLVEVWQACKVLWCQWAIPESPMQAWSSFLNFPSGNIFTMIIQEERKFGRYFFPSWSYADKRRKKWRQKQTCFCDTMILGKFSLCQLWDALRYLDSMHGYTHIERCDCRSRSSLYDMPLTVPWSHG